MLNLSAFAQSRLAELTENIDVSAEASATVSSGEYAPLWLSGNRHGVVSPYDNSAYERVGAFRSHDADSARNWKIGYGLDVVYSQNSQSSLYIHQAYADLKWKKAILTLGMREKDIDYRNMRLTSGGLSQGINAQPIPMAELDIDYFHLTKWWLVRARGSYGMTTDGAWQERFVGKDSGKRYNSNILYHEKALFWRFELPEKCPFTFDINIHMMTQFGGTMYNAAGRGFAEGVDVIKYPQDLKAFWNALQPFSSNDVSDGTVSNVAGNTLGSYNLALTYRGKGWKARAYFERFYEDQSMLTVQYGITDHLLGLDVQLPKNRFVSNVLVEHLSTKDQAGPVYHDPTTNLPLAFAGKDNYYNHNLYSGWQHWGMAIGSPLITSPVYNANSPAITEISGTDAGANRLYFYNNRIAAWHLGLNGNPCDEVAWRMLCTFTSNWGTYDGPFNDVIHECHWLGEATYTPQKFPGWQATLGVGVSHGDILGNTTGVQLTVRKSFKL